MMYGFSSVLIGLAAMPLAALQTMAAPADASTTHRVPGSPGASIQLAQAPDAGTPPAPASSATGATPNNGPPAPVDGPRTDGKSQRKNKPQGNSSLPLNGNGLSTTMTAPNGVAASPYGGQLPNGGLIPDGALMPSVGLANGGQPNRAGQPGTAQGNGPTQYGAGLPTNGNVSGTRDDQSSYTRRPLGASPVTRDIIGPFGGGNGYDARGVYTETAQQPYAYGQVYATTGGANGRLSPMGLEGTGPMRSLIPLPGTSTIRANSGYGLPNGSRPMHMDARGIQRYD